MTKIESRGFVIAVIMAAVLSSLFFTVSVLIKFEQKLPKEIVIYLNPDEPVHEEQKHEEASAQSAASTEEAVQETVEESPSEPPAASVKEEPAPKEPGPVVKQPEPKPQPVKTVTKTEKPKAQPKPAQKQETKPAEKTPSVQKDAAKAPKEEVVPVIKKSVEELTAEQTKKKATVNDFNWDSMDDGDDDFAPVQNQPKVSKVQSSVSGSAGTSSSVKSETVTTAGQGTSQSSKASSSTANALSNVNANKSNNAGVQGSSGKSAVSVKVGNSDVKFTGGEARSLIYPNPAELKVSKESARGIDNTRSVSIYLTVLESGSVPAGEISFKPEALLPEAVRSELKKQISEWRFSSSSSKSTASFEYTLVVK